MRKLRILGIGFIVLLLCSSTSLASQGYGPGRIGLKIFAGRDHVDIGDGGIWNSRDKLHIQLDPTEGWRIRSYHVDLGGGDDYEPPLTTTGNPKIGHFDYKDTFTAPYINEINIDEHIFRRTLVLDLGEDLGFQWGAPWADLRTQGVAIFLSMVKLDDQGRVIAETGAWAVPELVVWSDEPEAAAAADVTTETEVIADAGSGEVVSDEIIVIKWVGKGNKVAKKQHQKAKKSLIVEESEEVISFDGGRWGWWFRYEMAHPRTGHFIDSPVAGLSVETPTYEVVTGEDAAFDYFPGESVDISLGSILLGSAVADHKISPLDIFPMADTTNVEVGNMGSLLQSLDSDADPQGGITITSDTIDYLEAAMAGLGYESFDFDDSEQIKEIINTTIPLAGEGGLDLVYVDVEDARAHLDKTLDSAMFRKNVSKTPLLGSAKAKLNVMGVWFPALKANATIIPGENYPTDPEDYEYDEQVTIEYYDEEGNLIRGIDLAKPLVATYTDEDPETGAHDVWAAVSRDDGNTWKRKNISRMAYRSSFILANGEEFYGHCKKPVFQVKGNKILIAWTSKFARGGKPAYAIQVCPDTDGDGYVDPCEVCTGSDDNETCGLDYTYDDPYYTDDIWGVSGPQRSVDYTDQGYPEVGEVPYSAVWVARGIIATPADVAKGVGRYEGDIVWFKPERLTSARRDANQVFMGGADGAGFAISWQEDPGGLRPGEAKGPGPGWGGATTNHKTDIWYSYITWADFAKVDENFVSGGDSEHDDIDFAGRPKALVPMSLPVRISDNDAVNTDNLMVELGENGIPELDGNGNVIPAINPDPTSEDADGSHRYGHMLEGLWNWNGAVYNENDTDINWEPGAGVGALYEFTNQQDVQKRVVITADGRALDGNTGASRPNLFLQTYTKKDGSKSAWAIMAYEETKGLGMGPPDDTGDGTHPEDGSGYDPYVSFPDEGKNAIYHSFDFQTPDLVSAGTILNLPETDENGVELYAVGPEYLGSDDNGDPIDNPDAGVELTDWKGDFILAYENARRPRFILQSKAAAFDGIESYDEIGNPVFKNTNNSGTVLLVLYKEGEDGAGRPSDIMARRCVVKDADGNIKTGNPWSPENFLPGVQNVSTVMPGTKWVNPDRGEDAKGDGIKVCDWTQPEVCLTWKSGVNPYEDARAHRGAIRGDFVVMGYSYTPNWAASRNAHDKYDFYLRRSFNGGETWTTDPDAEDEDGNEIIVTHTDIFIDPDGISGAELTEEGDDESEATKHYRVETEYGPGVYEPARNVSLIKNNKTSVIEPRIVAVPGTIKVAGVYTGIAEDKQDPNVFYLAYGTSTNLPGVEKAPEDLFYSFSMDRGTTLIEEEWEVNPESEGLLAGETVTRWDFLAKGDPEQGEVQLRMTPDGSRFYSCWLQELAPLDPEDPTHFEGSDIWFRRIAPIEFPVNVSPDTVLPTDE